MEGKAHTTSPLHTFPLLFLVPNPLRPWVLIRLENVPPSEYSMVTLPLHVSSMQMRPGALLFRVVFSTARTVPCKERHESTLVE